LFFKKFSINLQMPLKIISKSRTLDGVLKKRGGGRCVVAIRPTHMPLGRGSIPC